jgi:hypothetical protein
MSVFSHLADDGFLAAADDPPRVGLIRVDPG